MVGVHSVTSLLQLRGPITVVDECGEWWTARFSRTQIASLFCSALGCSALCWCTRGRDPRLWACSSFPFQEWRLAPLFCVQLLATSTQFCRAGDGCQGEALPGRETARAPVRLQALVGGPQPDSPAAVLTGAEQRWAAAPPSQGPCSFWLVPFRCPAKWIFRRICVWSGGSFVQFIVNLRGERRSLLTLPWCSPLHVLCFSRLIILLDLCYMNDTDEHSSFLTCLLEAHHSCFSWLLWLFISFFFWTLLSWLGFKGYSSLGFCPGFREPGTVTTQTLLVGSRGSSPLGTVYVILYLYNIYLIFNCI